MTDNIQYIENKVKTTEELFKEGFNCAQAVMGSFAQETGLTQEQLFKFASSFGGGIGRLREVCGAVTGMCAIAGFLYGYTEPKNQEQKQNHYALIQKLVEQFKSENHSIICRELLGEEGTSTIPTPSTRTEHWYAKRPCVELVMCATKILAQEIQSK